MLITGIAGWIGQRRNAQGGVPSTTLLGLIISARGCSLLDYRGHPDTSVDANPGALAGGNLEFFWCSKNPDVGVARDAGDGEDVHDHPDAGNQ